MSMLLYYCYEKLPMECISEVEQMVVKVKDWRRKQQRLLLLVGWDETNHLSLYLLLQACFLQYSSV
jgi:hypothetical protein